MKTSRRAFVANAGAALAMARLSRAADKSNKIPVGLELYSVREELQKDMPGTLTRVAQIGYDCVEFYAPYHDWSTDQAQKVRAQLDQLKLKCYSTHNDIHSFSGDGLSKAIELNKILGAKYIVLAHPGGNPSTIDDWKKIADTLDAANNMMKESGLHAGYHNHDLEWKPVDGKRPMDVLAQYTDKNIMLQLDVGTCLEAGADPVEWINTHPGRIKSMHLKDWSPQNGYEVLFGEGVAPWSKLFAAAEKRGGVEFYLIEQEGSRFPEFETAERCLVAYKDLRSGKSS